MLAKMKSKGFGCLAILGTGNHDLGRGGGGA